MEKETNKLKLIKSVCDEDGVHQINLFQKSIDNYYLRNWVVGKDVKLLTLDGSLGGRNGSEFEYFTTDHDAQDDWHIGKKYDKQGWFRYPIVMERNDDKIITMRVADTEDEHNAYLVISKRVLRENNKSLKRAKTEEVKRIADRMADNFIYTFNNISNGEVYVFQFQYPNGEDVGTMEVGDVYGEVVKNGLNQYIIEEVMCNIPFEDDKFDTLFCQLLTDNDEN